MYSSILVLANLLRCDFLPRVWIPDQATIALRHQSTERATLVADRTRKVPASSRTPGGYRRLDLFSSEFRAW